MQKQFLWLCLLTFFLLGCSNTDVALTPVLTVSPTPFPTSETLTPTPTRSSAVFDLTASEILSDSAKYEGLTVRLTGRYGQLSTVACSNGVMAHRSPADWLLASGEELLFARGFEEQFRFLLPPGLTMTVEGTWRKWRGPIGCGKRAMVGDIWFVDVERIVDPNPIARVTLTPVAIADAGTAVPTPITDTIGNIPTPTPPVVFDAPNPIFSPTPLLTDTPLSDEGGTPPTLTSTPILEETTATPTLTVTRLDETVTATAVSQTSTTPTPTSSGTAISTTGTPTLTPTSSSQTTETPAPNEPTPTPPNLGATNTPTPVPAASSTATPPVVGTSIITLTEELSSFTLATETLADNQVHRWPIPIDLGDSSTAVLTATVFTADAVDMVIAITDAQGNILAQQNNANASTPELLTGFLVNNQTTYYLQISTADNTSATYVTTVMYDTQISFAFQDVIDYDDSISINIAAQQEHFWLLEATAGDTLVIEAMPDANTDVFIELYDPDANRISPAFVNSGANGVTEIYTRDLPEDGVYIIRIGEWAFSAGSYLITVREGAQ